MDSNLVINNNASAPEEENEQQKEAAAKQQAQANLDKNVQAHLKTFQDRHRARKPIRQERKAEGLANSKGYEKNINKYDFSAKGGKRFDGKDLAFLQKAGYSDREIGKFARSKGGKHLSEGIRHNNAKIAGKYATGDMAKGAKITDHDVGKGFNMADVNYLRSQGFGDAEIAKAANKAVTEGGKRHYNKMAKFMADQGQLNYDFGAWKSAKEKAQEVIENGPGKGNGGNNTDDVTKPGFPTPGQDGNENRITNSQEQNVKQDNDINTTITGDNNKVFNEQDNSIRQYGGDNRTLVIGGGPDSGRNSRGKYYTDADKAITMGTLGGFYAPDNSPAAQAKFTDLNQTLNRDAQKKYSNVGVTTAEKYSGFRGGDTNIQGLQKRIDQSDQYFRDLATLQEVKTYGDRAAKTKYSNFEFGAPIEEVMSNAGEIASGYKKDIDSI